MLNIIKDNLFLTGLMAGLYFLFAVSNVFLGIYLNINKNNEKFEIKRFLDGALKIFMLGLGLGTLVIGVSAIPTIFSKAGIVVISEEVLSGISILVILSIIAVGVVGYAKQCIDKVKEVFNKNGNEESKEE